MDNQDPFKNIEETYARIVAIRRRLIRIILYIVINMIGVFVMAYMFFRSPFDLRDMCTGLAIAAVGYLVSEWMCRCRICQQNVRRVDNKLLGNTGHLIVKHCHYCGLSITNVQ